MIVGLLRDASRTESLLNNLAEADFDLAGVSVIMSDVATRNKLTKDSGPLKGVAAGDLLLRLVRAGVTPWDGASYALAVRQGRVLVAMDVPAAAADAAAEMLQDVSADRIRKV